MWRKLQPYLLAFLLLLPMGTVGTVLHELGHYGAMVAAGYSPVLHYGSVSYGHSGEPRTCASGVDQVDAEWFAELVLLGHSLPEAKLAHSQDEDDEAIHLDHVQAGMDGLSPVVQALGIDAPQGEVQEVALYTTSPLADEVIAADLHGVSLFVSHGAGLWHSYYEPVAGQLVELPHLRAEVSVLSVATLYHLHFASLPPSPPAESMLFWLHTEVAEGVGGVGSSRHLDRLLLQDPLRGRPEWAAHLPSLTNLLVTAAGPGVSVVLGSLGLVWLFLLRARSSLPHRMDWRRWTASLMALFWSWFSQGFFTSGFGPSRPYSSDLDKVAFFFDVAVGWVELPLAVLAMGVCVVVVWLAERSYRLPLLTAGVGGAVVGAVLWLECVGPVVLP